MKKRIIILGSVVLFVVVAWSIAWLVLASIIRQNVEMLATADGEASPRVTCGTLSVGGYPFHFDVACAEATIVSGDFDFALPDLRVSARVYAPTHLVAAATGPVRITDSFTGTSNAVNWSSLHASLRVSDWRIARLSLSGGNLVWSDTLVGETVIAQSPLVEVHLMDMPEAHDAERRLAALAGYIQAQGVSYPGLTLTDTNAEAQLELTGLPDDIRNWSDPNLLPAIQANGGELRIVSVNSTDGNSSLQANGALTLDDQGQAQGSVTIHSSGVAERIGPLLGEPWQTLVLGTPSEDGSYTNQLNMSGGAIFSGFVPLATIPPLY